VPQNLHTTKICHHPMLKSSERDQRDNGRRKI